MKLRTLFIACLILISKSAYTQNRPIPAKPAGQNDIAGFESLVKKHARSRSASSNAVQERRLGKAPSMTSEKSSFTPTQGLKESGKLLPAPPPPPPPKSGR